MERIEFTNLDEYAKKSPYYHINEKVGARKHFYELRTNYFNQGDLTYLMTVELFDRVDDMLDFIDEMMEQFDNECSYQDDVSFWDYYTVATYEIVLSE